MEKINKINQQCKNQHSFHQELLIKKNMLVIRMYSTEHTHTLSYTCMHTFFFYPSHLILYLSVPKYIHTRKSTSPLKS